MKNHEFLVPFIGGFCIGLMVFALVLWATGNTPTAVTEKWQSLSIRHNAGHWHFSDFGGKPEFMWNDEKK